MTKTTIKEYIQNRIDYIYSMRPLIEYLALHSSERYGFRFNSIFGEYKYDIIIDRYYIHLTRYYKSIDNIHLLKNEILTETCVLKKDFFYSLRPIQYPINNEYSMIIGEYEMIKYKKNVLKPNYCIYCDKYFTNLKCHIRCKKHTKQKQNIIQNAFLNRLNNDCINNIISYI